jgi:hypothetical protein
VRKIETTCHTAYLHDMTGEGLILAPKASEDVAWLPGTASLHAADEAAMLRRLDGEGFELSEDEHGAPAWIHVGWSEDGREAFGLFGRAPITSAPTVQEQAAAHQELRRLAGLLPPVAPEQRQPEEVRVPDPSEGP